MRHIDTKIIKKLEMETDIVNVWLSIKVKNNEPFFEFVKGRKPETVTRWFSFDAIDNESYHELISQILSLKHVSPVDGVGIVGNNNNDGEKFVTITFNNLVEDKDDVIEKVRDEITEVYKKIAV